jgi:hypothetical protein
MTQARKLHATSAPLRTRSTSRSSTRSLFASTATSTPASRWRVMEELENRVMPSASLMQSFDGTGNNIKNAEWGSTDSQFIRVAAADYADGVSTPAGDDRPSARAISNAIFDQGEESFPNSRGMSDIVYVWGQFIDHDLDLTMSGDGSEVLNIQVPTGDPQFDPSATGTQVIPLSRSGFDSSTGSSTTNPRQQVNQITAFIDGSMVYGSDEARATALRTLTGGKLKTSEGNLLPLNTDGLDNINGNPFLSDSEVFVAGDIRVNENIELTAMQTLFMREHNRIADELAAKNPKLTDEQLYQKARRIVIAEIQAITYNEFLPALVGKNAIKKYAGYKPNVNPGITNEFSTAGFRLGHSLLGDEIEFVSDDGTPLEDQTLSLSQAFFNPDVIKENGIDTLLKGLTTDRSEELDTQVVDSVRNFLFGPPGAGGLDLVSLNIQRGRDHGLADYNTTRAAYGLPRVTTFAQITSDTAVQQQLEETYGSVDNIDLWVGALAESHLPNSSVGALVSRILSDQFTRLRDGDRFYYERLFKGKQLKELRNTHLSDIIKRNTTLTNLQTNVFFAPDSPGSSAPAPGSSETPTPTPGNPAPGNPNTPPPPKPGSNQTPPPRPNQGPGQEQGQVQGQEQGENQPPAPPAPPTPPVPPVQEGQNQTPPPPRPPKPAGDNNTPPPKPASNTNTTNTNTTTGTGNVTLTPITTPITTPTTTTSNDTTPPPRPKPVQNTNPAPSTGNTTGTTTTTSPSNNANNPAPRPPRQGPGGSGGSGGSGGVAGIRGKVILVDVTQLT